MNKTENKKRLLFEEIGKLLENENIDAFFLKELAAYLKGSSQQKISKTNFHLRQSEGKKAAESSVQAGIQNYDQLFKLINNLPGMAYRCKNDKHWTMVFVSSGCKWLTGYKPDEILYNNKVSYAELIHPDDRERVKKVVRSNLGSNVPFNVEYRLSDKSGKEHWVWEQGQIVVTDDEGESFVEGFIMDITERKKAEERLSENENQLKKAQTLGKIGSWKFDFEQNRVSVSEESARIYGLKPGKAYSIDEIQKFPLIEYRKMLDNAMERLVKKEKKYDVEFKIKRPSDGKIIDIHSTAEYNSDEQSVTGVIQDITKSKKAQRLLKESEQKYRSLIDNSSDAIYLIYKRRFRIINAAFENMLEYSLDELKELNIDPIQFIAPESRPSIEKRIQKIENNEEVDTRYEFIAVSKSGRKIDVEASVVYIPYKNGIATQGIVRDITERKISERKIKTLSEFRNLLVDLSANFIHVPLEEIENSINKSLQRLGQFVGADRSYIFEYNFEERYYRNTFEWCADGISPQIDNLQRVPLEWSVDLIEKHRNGEIVNIPDVAQIEQIEMRRFLEKQDIKSLLTLPLFNANECIGFVGFDAVENYFHFSDDEIDILQVYAKILVNSFERMQREKELVLAKERAEESDLLKSAFLANMSHEIRTPMNGILGFTNLLKDAPLTGEEQKESVDIILQSGERMLNTIDDIISISKIDSGTSELKPVSYDINKNIDYFYRFFKPEAEKKGLELRISKNSAPENPKITTDKEKLNAILSNLIKNAIKYTDQGWINAGYRFKENFVEFFVEDTGIGIKKEQQARIFDRFVQEDYSSTKPFEGVGLGLSIAKGYVEMLGGDIRVESEKGKGSRFTFTVPALNS